ncbi:MAG: hypothetical protein V2A73_10030, partial [Pseudomonadota bacterium]
RRVENLSASYGRRILELCGVADVEGKDALWAIGDEVGQLPLASCFIGERPECRFAASVFDGTVPAIDERTLRFELCTQAKLPTSFLVVDASSAGRTYIPMYSDMRAQLRSAIDQWNTAVLVGSDAFTWGARIDQRRIDDIYSIVSLAIWIDSQAVAAASSQCANEFGGVEYPLRLADDNSDSSSAEDCYRGLLGEAFFGMHQAQAEWEVAKKSLDANGKRLDAQNAFCVDLVDDESERKKLRDKHRLDQVALWENVSSLEMELALAGVAGYPNPWYFDKMKKVQVAKVNSWVEDIGFSLTLEQQAAEDKVAACQLEAEQYRLGIEAELAKVELSVLGSEISRIRFNRLLGELQQTILEGRAVVMRELDRTVPSIAHDYWLDERIDRFRREMEWARMLTFLAMRAVEYEFQQQLDLREQIIKARHPDELAQAVQTLRQEQLTRTIGGRRPEGGSIVLSVRDDVLDLASRETFSRSERNWEQRIRFQQRLWDPEYAVFDRDKRYLGQGIPIVLTPEGALRQRCAERLWRVVATIQGDLLGVETPSAPVFLLARNLFLRQWCDGHGDGSGLQAGAMQSQLRLRLPTGGNGDSSLSPPYATAMLYPWLNVPRSLFYSDGYGEGGSNELAGRGLYGEYVLLFPWDGLLEYGFPLEQVEDVLLRFDYLSVDDLSM